MVIKNNNMLVLKNIPRLLFYYASSVFISILFVYLLKNLLLNKLFGIPFEPISDGQILSYLSIPFPIVAIIDTTFHSDIIGYDLLPKPFLKFSYLGIFFNIVTLCILYNLFARKKLEPKILFITLTIFNILIILFLPKFLFFF